MNPIKLFLTIGLLFLGLSLSAQLGLENKGPQLLQVGGIEVEGNEYISESIIIARSGLEVGSYIEVPGDEITNAIKRLWEMQLFSDVGIYEQKRLSGSTIFLSIKVQTLPKLGKYFINGVSKQEADDLKSTLGLTRLTPVNEALKARIKTKTKRFFTDKGFYQAGIEVVEKPDTSKSNAVVLTMKIDKGPRVRIKEIAFNGNDNAHPRKLRRVMKSTKEKVQFRPWLKKDKPFLKDSLSFNRVTWGLANISIEGIMNFVTDRVNLGLFSPSTFKKDEYMVDKNQLINYYNSIGYRDATVMADTIWVTESDMFIEIDIDEGNRYYFGDIEFAGNAKYSDKILSKQLGIKKGDVYSRSKLETNLLLNPNGADVSSLYLDDGYLFFNATPTEVKVEGDTIDFEIRVYEGPQATIDKVIIKGNDRTKEHVIRRELRTLPGDKFSRDALIRSQREIANLGHFDPEQIGVIPIPHPESGTVDIEYTVAEKSSDQLELSLGWGGAQTGLIGSAGVVFNNFSLSNVFNRETWNPLPQGDGQKLSFRLNTNGRAYRNVNVSFTEPWFGGKKPNSLTLGYFNQLLKDIRDPELDSTVPDNGVLGTFSTNGLSLSYGFRLKWPDDFFTLVSTVNYRRYNLDNWDRSNFIIQDGAANNLSFQLTWARNSISNPIYPRTGSTFSLSGQWTPPFSGSKDLSDAPNNEKYKWIEYHKYRLKTEYYVPLWKDKLVLKTSAKFGWLGAYNKSIGISPFERFEVGGDGLTNVTFYGTDIISLRGYDPFSNSGGEAVFNKFTAEVRYPFSLNPSATFFGLLFAEGGNSYTDVSSYNPFKLNRSVGFGLRAFLPMFGLLGLDYGIPFDEPMGNGIVESEGVFDYMLNNGKFRFILGFEPE